MKRSHPHLRVIDDLKPLEREAVEDLLRALLECEHRRQPAYLHILAALGGTDGPAALRSLTLARTLQLVVLHDDVWSLADPTGREIAIRVMRAHRLTETRLAHQSGRPPADWHGIAHRAEHAMTDAEINRLADLLGNPRFDPHGDPIPTREGLLPAPEGQPLLAWPVGTPGVIAHVEDEPPGLFKKLVLQGLYAGMRFVRESQSDQICALRVENRSLALPAELAALIRARTLQQDETMPPSDAFRLSDLGKGQCAAVVTLLPGCLGPERSRLLDLGFVPGSLVCHELVSPLRDPVAYRVRGTMIALRRTQSDQVLVRPSTADSATVSPTLAAN